ncbi:hypothetical protein Emed_005935 [Eimeria media]
MAEDNEGRLLSRHLEARGGLGPRPAFPGTSVQPPAFTSPSNISVLPIAASGAHEDPALACKPQDLAGRCRLVRGVPTQRHADLGSHVKPCIVPQGRAGKLLHTRATTACAESSLKRDPACSDVTTLPQMHACAPDSTSVDVRSPKNCEASDAHDALKAKNPQISCKGNGPLPLYGHLLSSILALVGDTPSEKSKLAFVSKDWRDALDVHTAWPSVNATHRPLSSLLNHAGHLKRLFVGAEALSLAEGDTPRASRFLTQLVEAKPTAAREDLPSPSQDNLSADNNTTSSAANLTTSTSSRKWNLPSLRRLRIHRSLGAGYVSYVTPGALFAAMDSMPLKRSSLIESNSAEGGGLQHLEELVVECEVGAEVLLALRGKTPKLRSLVIAQLAADPSTSAVERENQTTGDSGDEEKKVTNFEALLLLLQSLPPQQLRVFGLNTALPRNSTTQSEGGERNANSSSSARAENACKGEVTTVQDALLDLRKRLEERRKTGFPEEAESDELLSVLTQQQNETLCAIWTPHVEPSFVALQALRRNSKNLKYCSVPGSSVMEYLRL